MSKANRLALVLIAGTLLLAAAVAPESHALAATPGAGIEPEVSPAAAALLQILNTAPESKLRSMAGLTPDVVGKLLAHRATGARLKNLVELTNVTGIRHSDLETLMKPFVQEDLDRQAEANRKPVPDPATKSKAGRLQRNTTTVDPNAAAPAAEPDGAITVTGSGPIGAVRPGFYSKLPGYPDLDTIDPLKRKEFLETINREMCSCGCKGETLAYCIVNDPGCPVVKARVKKIYDDIMTKPPR